MCAKKKADVDVQRYKASELEAYNLWNPTKAKKARIERLHVQIEELAKAVLTQLTKVPSTSQSNAPVPELVYEPRAFPGPTLEASTSHHEYADFKQKIRAEGRRVQGSISFLYVKPTGEQSQRTVELEAAYPALHPDYLLGHCALRGEDRTFTIYRMHLARNVSTGNPIFDIHIWLAGTTVRLKVEQDQLVSGVG